MKPHHYLLILLCALIAGGAAWIGRGYYDRSHMMEGYLQIANISPEGHDIRIDFPSGQSVGGFIPGRGGSTIRVRNTGEDRVTVSVDGKAVGGDHVHFRGHPTVLTVGKDRVDQWNIYTDLRMKYFDETGQPSFGHVRPKPEKGD